ARSAGAVMVTAGGVLRGPMTTVRCAWERSPPASVTAAVMVCVPTLRRAVAKLAPAPMRPSRSELQMRLADRAPSVASTAVPANVSGRSATRAAPGAGAGRVGDRGRDLVGANPGRTRGEAGPGAEGSVEARSPADARAEVAVLVVGGGGSEGEREPAREQHPAVRRRADAHRRRMVHD